MLIFVCQETSQTSSFLDQSFFWACYTLTWPWSSSISPPIHVGEERATSKLDTLLSLILGPSQIPLFWKFTLHNEKKFFNPHSIRKGQQPMSIKLGWQEGDSEVQSCSARLKCVYTHLLWHVWNVVSIGCTSCIKFNFGTIFYHYIAGWCLKLIYWTGWKYGIEI